MNEFETAIQQAIRKIEELKRDCIVHNFKLIKIELPGDLFEELAKRTKQVLIKEGKDFDSYIGFYMGVPVERNERISGPRYVIEGDLEML